MICGGPEAFISTSICLECGGEIKCIMYVLHLHYVIYLYVPKFFLLRRCSLLNHELNV